MHKLLTVALVLFSLSLTAAANDSKLSADPTSPSDSSNNPAPTEYYYIPTWQLDAGFQFQHYQAFGDSFPNYGFHTDFTRTLNRWGSLEGMAAVGVGHAGGQANPEAKSFFVGGGPRFTKRSQGRFEPWVHALVGLDEFRFTQTGTLGKETSIGWLAGIGADYKFRPRIYWRFEGDYLGTYYKSTPQSNVSIGTGLVIDF